MRWSNVGSSSRTSVSVRAVARGMHRALRSCAVGAALRSASHGRPLLRGPPGRFVTRHPPAPASVPPRRPGDANPRRRIAPRSENARINAPHWHCALLRFAGRCQVACSTEECRTVQSGKPRTASGLCDRPSGTSYEGGASGCGTASGWTARACLSPGRSIAEPAPPRAPVREQAKRPLGTAAVLISLRNAGYSSR
jgi:hypothetical protein